MADDRREISQADKFKELARQLEAEHGPADAGDFDALLGTVGRTPHKTEAEAREEEGKPPRP